MAGDLRRASARATSCGGAVTQGRAERTGERHFTAWPLRLCVSVAGVCLWVSAAQAVEALPDPTLPPQAVYSGTGEIVDNRRLTSVVRPKDGDPVAVIGGKVVPLGGKVGNARLVRIDESGALLAGPDGQEVLLMTPDAIKTSQQDQNKKIQGEKIQGKEMNAATRRSGERR
jgi:hypothetical protein